MKNLGTFADIMWLFENFVSWFIENLIPILFVYIPFSIALVIMVESIDIIRCSIMLEKDCKRGRNRTARVIGWHIHDESFRETGKIPGFIYPIVAYKRSDNRWVKMVGNKPCIRKKGTEVRIRVCSDGIAHDAYAGIRVFCAGVIGIIIAFAYGGLILSMSSVFLTN